MTLNELDREIKRASKFVAYQWPGVISAEDTEQELYIRLLESPGTVQKILGMDETARYRAVVWMANQIASRERTEYDHFKGSYRYSVAEVKTLLKTGAIKEQSLHMQDLSDDRVSTGKAESTLQVPVDVTVLKEALVRVADKNLPYATAIIRRYRLDESMETKSEENALSRGTELLANEMNRVNRTKFVTRDDGPGTRTPVRRETAKNISDQQWDDDDYLSQREGVWDA